MTAHVERLFGRPAPSPVPHCAECARWAALRDELRSRADRSGVSDVNVMLRDHQQRAHGTAG